jgi:hypothetical protein
MYIAIHLLNYNGKMADIALMFNPNPHYLGI